MKSLNDLIELVGENGLIPFEHGFEYPIIRGYKVWGIGTDTKLIYCIGKKIAFDELTNKEINILYNSAYTYIYEYEY
jgi:hypothetical protein